MGWETLAIVGFQAISGMQGMSQAKKQAGAVVREGEYAAQNTADNTIRTAGKLTTSFLQSGLTLEGGPMDVLKQAFTKGYTDINRIKDNANTQSNNIVSAARTKAIQQLGLAAAGAAGGSSNGITNAYNGFGQTVGSIFDPSPVGPYQPYFSGI